ncbi:hypothetical protein [Qipengyuania marisflavi]|uniref:Antifreeze protein n=1 Tax=Qipengyuania marisflavi TaxID=2486356 RepID=A0A5S3P7A0_9SPHN|nr:hypothetical protein [Qipengyuania marisflavi]TMM46726.1 hypothetical protein FEV51_10865 [Qipengyuania marisflavi]
MARTSSKTWPELASESWLLASDAAVVIWLRSMRLMMGGPLAAREAERMVSEKLTASMTLLPALMQGGLTQTPEALGAKALAHYRAPVAANRKRLSGSSRA